MENSFQVRMKQAQLFIDQMGERDYEKIDFVRKLKTTLTSKINYFALIIKQHNSKCNQEKLKTGLLLEERKDTIYYQFWKDRLDNMLIADEKVEKQLPFVKQLLQNYKEVRFAVRKAMEICNQSRVVGSKNK